MEVARLGSRRARLIVLGVAWVVLVVLAVGTGVEATERELGSRAEVALTDAGLAVEAVEMDGRTAVVAVGEASPDAVVAALDVVSGLAGVQLTGVVAVDEPEPAPPAGETSTTTTATTTTTPAPGTIPDDAANLRASLENGKVLIEGAIPDAEVAAEVGALAELVYAPLLENALEVDESLESAPWVPNAAAIVTRLTILGTASVRVVGSTAIVTGVAPNDERLQQFVGAMQQALGAEVTVDNEVLVTGYSAPFVRADAPGDGSVRLTGTMPSVEITEMIAGTAAQVFGSEAVINDLQVGERVDTTFSLFRLPLAFTALAPIPQWEVEIDDNVITGELRGGATFPSGSSKLTPELVGLMPVAAGILARNPTLGMIIEGHTDSVGSDEANLQLSVARAESARVWLIQAGIAAERVLAVGYGETEPIGDNTTAAGRALNRRVEFVLAPASALGDQ
jgi:outer membrane protein OmpA-like peptidoglycan-associated protein